MSIVQIRNQAKKALLDGKYKQALPLFEQLHQAAPKDLRTYVKLAELRERTGDSKAAMRDYVAIAKEYAEQGFVVQAIAINKIILRLDPNRTEIKDRLKELCTERGEDWAVSTITAQDQLKGSKQKPLDQKKLSVERTPLLSGLSGDEFEAFMDSLALKHYAKNDVVFKMGDAGESLYLVAMGTLRLEMTLPTGKKRVFSQFSEGDFFGEIAFMSHGKHVDTAIADDELSILEIDRNIFDIWVKKHPKIQSVVELFYRQRVLARVLAMTPIFDSVPAEARTALADKFQLHTFKKDEVVINEGKSGKSFFLIRSGQVSIMTRDIRKVGENVQLGTMEEGDFFGEVALLTDKPRTATVVANGDLELMELTRDDFNEIVQTYPSIRNTVEGYQKQRVQNTIKRLMERN